MRRGRRLFGGEGRLTRMPIGRGRPIAGAVAPIERRPSRLAFWLLGHLSPATSNIITPDRDDRQRWIEAGYGKFCPRFSDTLYMLNHYATSLI
jgi:hypothetical protein